MHISDQTLIDCGLRVIAAELEEIINLKKAVNYNFAHACKIILNCSGKVIVTGMGKSGHIGKKIAATLASTGTPAFFVHPGEALHGDLGMIAKNDVVLAISYSGENSEIISLVPPLKRLAVPLIAFTGYPNSALAQYANCNLNIAVSKEACSLGLAPTSSTTATLVMGDALAISLLSARGFTSEDFAKSHPGGKLGKRLLIKVADIMHSGENIPSVSATATIAAAIVEMTKKRLGMTAIIDKHNKMLGIFTDGDLRRFLDKTLNIHTTAITTVMNKNFITISSDTLAIAAVQLMEQHQILMLPVVDNSVLVGAFNMHDLFRAGVV